jgi:surfeit locus 1 family protein
MRPEHTPRLDLKLAVTVALAFLILITLGTWQVLRLQWKTELLHKIEMLQSAPAKPLAEVLNRSGDADFVRVTLNCTTLNQSPTLKTYALSEAGQVGDRILTACPIATAGYDALLVDRGFTPKGTSPPTAALPLKGSVVGVLRKPTPPSGFAPKPTEVAGEWTGRDLPAMARQLKAANPAPYFLELETPTPASGYPKPEPVSLGISNNHLGYAITWFGLAAALIGVYIGYLRRKV